MARKGLTLWPIWPYCPHMTLKQYWGRHRASLPTLRALAAHLGLPEGSDARTVQRYVEHERVPDRAIMRQIAEHTKGKVGLADWPDRPLRMPKRERTAVQAA